MARKHRGWMRAAFALTAVALAGCGGTGSSGSPEQAISTFLHAAAAGDGATACAQLSPHAQTQVVQGAPCEEGIKLGAGLYSSIIKQIKIIGVRTQRNTASGTSMLNGRPIATFRLTKSGGKWLIVSEHRTSASASTGSGAAGFSGPSLARVAAVSQCLEKTLGAVDNAGADSAGGVPHVVLAVNVAGYTAAEVNVFASSAAAGTAYAAIKTREGSLTTKLGGGAVIVYFKAIAAGRQREIEACG